MPGGGSIARGAILAGIVTFRRMPIELIALTGATLMVVTGVLTPRSPVRALNRNILAVIAGSVGLGVVVVNSTLGEHISSAILSLSTGSTALVVLVVGDGYSTAACVRFGIPLIVVCLISTCRVVPGRAGTGDPAGSVSGRVQACS